MKGTFFNKDIEFSLEINGETWKQGDTISGNLKILNRSSESVGISKIGCFLAIGNAKKIKEKHAAAYALLDKSLFGEEDVLAPNTDKKLDFNFELSKDCHISEKASSLHLLCGIDGEKIDVGSLRLSIVPFEVISQFLEIFENFYKFKVKSLKPKKNFIEATIAVPPSKEFTGVEQLKLMTRMDGENLELNYRFKVKKLDFSAQSTKVKDEVVVVENILTPKQYHIYGSAINQDEIISHLDNVLGNVRVKSFF